MSSWLIFALITPFIWAFSNIVDRLFAERVVGDERILTFMSALVRLPYALLLFAMSGFFIPDMSLVLWGLVAGFLNVFPFLFYYRALKTEDAYTVILVYVVTHPISILLMTTLWGGEIVVVRELVAGAILIFAAALATVRFDKKIQIRWPLLWSVLATVLWSFADVVWGKSLPLFPSLTVFMTWFLLGSSLLAGVYLFIPGFIKSATTLYQKTKLHWFVVFAATTGGVVVSYFTYSGALLLERISVTAFVITVQPLFVFLMTFVAAKMKLNSDFTKMSKKELGIKISAFIIAAVGIVLISVPL